MKFALFLTIIACVTAELKINDFFVGTSTSSYQIEGHCPGESIWDVFTAERSLQPVGEACNHYELYKDDIKLLYDLNLKHYRFSISWTRIMPFKWNEINPEGIKFYHNILDELIKYNITPYVTMYHWDLPNYIQKDWGGWANSSISKLFVDYSKILFEEYNSKVKFWITINEPLTTSLQGYETGTFAPGIISQTQKYLSAHNQLRAHIFCAKYYKENYPNQGKIGIALNTNWYEPKDVRFPKRAEEEMLKNFGWFADPLFLGDYPDIIKPYTLSFTSEEKLMLTASLDFLGLNHYTTYYIDNKGEISIDPLWIKGASSWLYDVSWGMNKILNYINSRYGTIPIFITECGFSMKHDSLLDTDRINYLTGYLYEAVNCNENGINVKGFFIWSFLDNFEWASGYTEKFGIVHVNRTNWIRTPKQSALLISDIIT